MVRKSPSARQAANGTIQFAELFGSAGSPCALFVRFSVPAAVGDQKERDSAHTRHVTELSFSARSRFGEEVAFCRISPGSTRGSAYRPGGSERMSREPTPRLSGAAVGRPSSPGLGSGVSRRRIP